MSDLCGRRALVHDNIATAPRFSRMGMRVDRETERETDRERER